MASIPGISGSSDRGSNQPPKKRSRMEIDSSSNPESEQGSLYSDQPGSVSSVLRMQPEYLQCPVCQEYPRREVYQCDEGHTVCNECYSNITFCPVCGALYNYKNIRCLVAEFYLGGMTFNCSFRNSGCLETNIPRNRLTAHEIQCEHNPTPSGFKCSLFDSSENCEFRIDPKSIIQDPEHSKDVIEHLTLPPHELHHRRAQIGKEMLLRFRLPISHDVPACGPVILFEVYNGYARKVLGYYVLILRLSMPARTNLSWAVVGLNSAPLAINGANRHSDKITVKFSIKAKTDPNKVARDGDGCVPNQNWTIKSMYLDEWEEFMMTPIEDRPPFSFTVPLNFLSEYYERVTGKYEMSVRFGPLVK